MSTAKNPAASTIYPQLIDKLREVSCIKFVAFEIDGLGNFEDHANELTTLLKGIVDLSRSVPKDFEKAREFAVDMIEAHDDFSSRMSRLDINAQGSLRFREESCGEHLWGFLRKYADLLRRYKCEFQHELSCITSRRTSPELEIPTDPDELEAWDRETNIMRLVAVQMKKHPEWKTAKNWKSSRIADAVNHATNFDMVLTQPAVSRYIKRITQGEYDQRFDEQVDRKSRQQL